MAPSDIILFGYPTSPYYGKLLLVLNYLQLPFKVCAQPRMLPRPDFESVGITYRRIPLLSIDGHVYCDTNLIIDKLCTLAGVPNHRETEVLGNAMFPYCAGLIPYEMIADPAFLKDRSALTGRPWAKEQITAGRPNALTQFQAYLQIIRQVLKNGGGGYVRDGKVTMADLHLVFVVQWVLMGHKGGQPEVNPEMYPDIYAWLDNVHASLKKLAQGKPGKITFEEARKQITAPKQTSAPQQQQHDENGPLGLKVGAQVAVTPTDTGRTHPQVGQLQYMNASEVCLKTSAGVLISFPRVNYSVTSAKSGKL